MKSDEDKSGVTGTLIYVVPLTVAAAWLLYEGHHGYAAAFGFLDAIFLWMMLSKWRSK